MIDLDQVLDVVQERVREAATIFDVDVTDDAAVLRHMHEVLEDAKAASLNMD